jgi:hypothetical protein
MKTIALLLMSAVAFAGDPRPFEGKWALDKKGSKDAQAPGNLVQEIRRQGGNIVINSKYEQPKNGVYPMVWLGIMTEKLELNPDGRQITNTIGPYKYASKTTVFGNSMVTDWNAVDRPGSVKGQWVRTLNDDGKTMTMRVKVNASDGKSYDRTLLFKKK